MPMLLRLLVIEQLFDLNKNVSERNWLLFIEISRVELDMRLSILFSIPKINWSLLIVNDVAKIFFQQTDHNIKVLSVLYRDKNALEGVSQWKPTFVHNGVSRTP